MDLKDTLMAYSEWLDSEHLITSDVRGDHRRTLPDKRTHEELAKEFIDWWEDNPDRAPLVGRGAVSGEPVKGSMNLGGR